MSLASSLNVGVSALRSYSEGLQVVSNNIANVNTVGYKVSRAQYSDTFSNILKPLVPNENNTAVKIAPTQVGGGVQVEAIAPVFSQGTIQTTSSNSDLAIAGNGFFRVKNPQTGQAFVTRAGNFRVDADGYMVTQQGYRVQGSIGAITKVVYDSVNGSYDVKGPQDNVKVNIPSGMRTQSISATATANSAVLTGLSATDAAILKVGMPISGGTYPTGTVVKSISGGVVTLSSKATTTAPVSLDASLLSVDAESLNLVFPPDHARPTLIPGMVLSGPGIEPGTTIESVTGNLKALIPASASSVTLTGVTFPATVINVASAANLEVGMVLSPASGGGTLAGFASNPRIVKVDKTTNTIVVDQGCTAAGAGVSVTATPITGSAVTATLSSFSAEAAGRTTVAVDSVAGLGIGMVVSLASGFAPGAKVKITGIDSANGTITVDKVAVSSISSSSAVASGDKTLEAGTSTIRLTDVTGIMTGMSVSGDGLPAGAFVGTITPDSTFNDNVVQLVDAAGNPIIIPSSSYSPVTLGFGDQTVVLSKRPNANTFDTASLSVSTQYKPSSKIGDLRVSFNEGTDFTYYGTNGVELTGIPLEAARSAGPRIRTFNVGTNGQVNVILSNGQTFSGGSVLIQSFKDPGALIREGDNMFSGIFTAGPYNGAWADDNITGLTPGFGGLGSINGGALELSNVDIGEEFSTMIVTQRAFQAGSRVITIADQMMEEAVNLKR
jgi:flagellar hook protein FlgE